MTTLSNTVHRLATEAWLAVPAPTPTAPPGSEKFLAGYNWFFWGLGILAVCGVGLAGAKMFMNHRNGEENGKPLVLSLFGCIVIGGAAGLAGYFVG